nr:2H phosphodiest domain containing protein [Marseillevirus futianmevirus]
MKKISSSGKYLPFFGVTTLCFVQRASLERVEQCLVSCGLSRIFSPLPCESYHMTVFDLVVPEKAQTHKKFERFLLDNSPVLKNISLVCDGTKATFCSLVAVYWTNGTIGLEVSYNEEGLRDKISKASGIHNKPYKFHITLAYRIRDGAPSMEQLKALELCLNQVFPGGIVPLTQCFVCKFEDMTEFIKI